MIPRSMGSNLPFRPAYMANLSYWRKNGNTARGAMVFLLGVLISLAVISAGCTKSSSDADKPGKDATTDAEKAAMHLDPFVVNLADTEDNRYLRVGIDLALAQPSAGKEGGATTARVRDCIIFVLSTWHSDALLATDGKQKLKDEILRALQDRVPELRVKEVYFTEFLVQR